jgi:hypothetical protein
MGIDRHLIELSQLRQIKFLYGLTDEQLGKPPKYPSLETKRLEDCKSHLGTYTVNLKAIHYRPTIRTVAPKQVGRLMTPSTNSS